MKETKIEKLILDLSNRWDCSPQEAVDRLNSMNESEINKLINSMTKKFKNGGTIDCLRAGNKLSECRKCGGKVSVAKAQNGTEISRRDALNMLRTTGSTNRESRQEYRTAKRTARQSGLSGDEMRQTARQAMMNRGVNRILPALDDPIINDEPIVIDNTPIDVGNIATPSIQKMDNFGGSFSSAFGAARRSGLNEFTWNGKRYNTQLAPESTSSVSESLPGASGPNPTHTGGTVNTSGWIASPGYQPGIWRTAISYLKNKK